MTFWECLILSGYSSRGKNKERASQAGKATGAPPSSIKQHVRGIHSALLRKNGREKP